MTIYPGVNIERFRCGKSAWFPGNAAVIPGMGQRLDAENRHGVTKKNIQDLWWVFYMSI